MQLQGKTALITGATTGIGFATAETFLADGVSALIITGQNDDRLSEAAAKLVAQSSASITPVQWRAEAEDDVAALVETVKRSHGQLDIVFANAGVTWPAPLGQIERTEAQRQFLVNATAPLMLIQALAPLMREGGSIILNTSCLDVLGMPGMTVYAASKAAMRSFARMLSMELKDRGIRVNAVAPGPTETPIYNKIGMSENDLDAMAEGIAREVPLGRFARREEIAGAVAYFASDASRYVIGEEINVDGGWTTL